MLTLVLTPPTDPVSQKREHHFVFHIFNWSWVVLYRSPQNPTAWLTSPFFPSTPSIDPLRQASPQLSLLFVRGLACSAASDVLVCSWLLLASGEKTNTLLDVQRTSPSACCFFLSASLHYKSCRPAEVGISLPSVNFQLFFFFFHHFIFRVSLLPLRVSLFLWGNYISLSVRVGSVAFYVRRTWKWLVKH